MEIDRRKSLMVKVDRDEERIMMKVVVDAYGPEEQAMGWYYIFAGYDAISLYGSLHRQAAYFSFKGRRNGGSDGHGTGGGVRERNVRGD
jgi:hypothetical protein